MEENLRGFLVYFYFEHYEEHFTNISKYWKFQANRFWKQFWFYGVNSKGTKHIMSVSKLHSIHVELQKFWRNNSDTCSSHMLLKALCYLHELVHSQKQDQHYCIAREMLLQKNTHCEPYAHNWFFDWGLFFVWDYYFCWPKSRWILRFNILIP